MHITMFNDSKILNCFNFFNSSVLKNNVKNNHFTINNELYLTMKEEKKLEKFKKKIEQLNISQIDVVEHLKYKPELKFVNKEGEELKKTGHKIFFFDNLKFNILQGFNFVNTQNGIIVVYDWNHNLYEKMQKAKEIKEIAIKYEEKKAEAEKKYQKELMLFEQQKKEYQEKTKKYRQTKKEIEEFNRKEKELAKKEKRKPNLKKMQESRPVKPKIEKPKKEKVNIPIQLDSIRLKDHLNEILLAYLFEIKRSVELELNTYILIPSRELQSSIFKRENLLQLNEPEEISAKEFSNIIEKKAIEENEDLKKEKSFFYNSFVYGYSSNANKYVNVDALISLIELGDTVTEWNVLENFATPQKEKELPILTKLKPNQTASMLAGGIGAFAKEVKINGEKLLIKGATVKTKTKREVNLNNMIIEEIIENYSQEIGVLNLDRRELQIIK